MILPKQHWETNPEELDTILESDIPKQFRLAFNLISSSVKDDTIENLLKGYIEGIKGISASKVIFIYFFGVARDAMLIMDSQKLLDLNKGILEKIEYNNPRAMMADNMRVLRRIWNKENYLQGVIFKLFEYVMSVSQKLGYVGLFYNMRYTAMYHDFSYWYADHPEDQDKINSVKDAARWVMKIIPKIIEDKIAKKGDPGCLQATASLVEDDWIKLIDEAILAVGRGYGIEGEWIVNKDILYIPEGSRIFVLIYDKPEKGLIDKYLAEEKLYFFNEKVEKYLKGEEIIKNLKKRYTVIHVSAEKFDKIKERYFEKYG